METFRRLVFAIAVFVIASIVFSLWRGGNEGYGLKDFVQGRPPQTEPATLPEGPKLNLDDVKLLSAMSDEFARLSAAVLPSVVSVTTKTVRRGQTAWHPFFGLVAGRSQVIPGLGSGAIISKEGHVITNYHVIADVSEVMITTNDNKKYPARILNYSRERDIALLKIENSGGREFTPLAFADSDKAKVGQIVFAVGNPFGLSGTVTQGIISARDRHLSDSQMDYLQTDTVINPGNSGGPLVNILGEIVGINVAIFQGDENVRAWQGVGLAVPAKDAKRVVDAILAQANRTPGSATEENGYLGLELSVEPVQVDNLVGAFVNHLDARSPAAGAGLRPGDIIVSIDGRNFQTPSDLLAIIRSLQPGKQVVIRLVRDRQLAEITAIIGQRPAGE